MNILNGEVMTNRVDGIMAKWVISTILDCDVEGDREVDHIANGGVSDYDGEDETVEHFFSDEWHQKRVTIMYGTRFRRQR